MRQGRLIKLYEFSLIQLLALLSVFGSSPAFTQQQPQQLGQSTVSSSTQSSTQATANNLAENVAEQIPEQPQAGQLPEDKKDIFEETAPPWPMQIPKVPVKFDWVLLKKGELFAGELIAMYQDRVEFDSDEVGVISIKMKDILQIRTKTIMSVRSVDNRVLFGKVMITEDKVTFIGSTEHMLARSDVLTLSPAEREGQSLWDGELSLGLNFSSGNSERFDYLMSGKARRLSAGGRFSISYTGIYAQVQDSETGESVTTESNQRFNLGYDYFYSKKLYFRVPNFELYNDDFKNLDLQATLGVAIGYEVIDDKIWDYRDIELNLYAGPSIQFTRFNEVEVGEDDEDTSPALAFGFDFELDLTRDTEFYIVYDAKLVNKRSGSMINHLEVGIEVEVIDDFDIEVATILDHVVNPTADEEGSVPEKLDSLLTVSLEYEF